MAEPVRVPAFQAPTGPLRPETAPTAVVRTPALGAAPAPVVAPAPAEVTIVCPECGTASAVALARRDADDFCPTCDYPLFWARPQDRTVPPQDGPDDARRRSPGASGALLLATVPCPVCEEPEPAVGRGVRPVRGRHGAPAAARPGAPSGARARGGGARGGAAGAAEGAVPVVVVPGDGRDRRHRVVGQHALLTCEPPCGVRADCWSTTHWVGVVAGQIL